MKSKQIFTLLAALLVTVTFIGCSSSGSDSGGTDSGTTTSKVTVGTMTKGSVIVGGVTFAEDNLTRIAGDDTSKTAADLQSGMTVRVRGKVSDDGINGTAERVEIENEVRGAMTKTGPDTFTVHGQGVLVDGATLFANVANFAALNNGDNVEVHGQRDAAQVIRASRVEKLGAGAVDDEVRGTVGGLAGNLVLGGSFTIGSLSIATSNTTSVTPAGSVIANGALVEVHLSGNTATRIHLESAEAELEPAENEEFEVEGFVSGCAAGAACGSDFKVNDKQVRTSSSTRFEGGVKNDVVNDMKVEAEGRLSGGILSANKITLKETVRIEANATTAGSANLLGKTVLVTSKTEFSSNLTGTAGIALNDGLRIRGFVNKNSDGTDASSITATRVEKQSQSVDVDKIILRGPVKDINSSAHTFSIVGITINTDSIGAARPDDDSGSSSQTISRDSFFSSLVANRTIVKARGSISGTTLTANEIEIE